MTILKHGDPERLRKPRNFKCDACGCIFVAEKHEYTTKQIDYDGSTTYEAVCPDCHSKATSNNKGDILEWVKTETLAGDFVFKCPHCDCLTVDAPSTCPNPKCKKHLLPPSIRGIRQ